MKKESPPSYSLRGNFGWPEIIAVSIVLFLLIGLLISGLSGSRSAAVGMECADRLRRIAAALHDYHDVYGSFPPAFSADSTGAPLQSWRVLILPFLGHAELYEKIRRDEPWDSDWNRRFHHDPAIRSIFLCPTAVRRDGVSSDGGTSYSAVVGDGTVFPGSEAIPRERIADGLSETVLLVERREPVNWMDPNHEIRLEANGAGGVGSLHSGAPIKMDKGEQSTGFFIALADGSVRFIDSDIDPAVWKRLLRRNDEETARNGPNQVSSADSVMAR